jgi:hypothetical protein
MNGYGGEGGQGEEPEPPMYAGGRRPVHGMFACVGFSDYSLVIVETFTRFTKECNRNETAEASTCRKRGVGSEWR